MNLRTLLFPFIAAACVFGCSNKPDPRRDFEMGLDGGRFLWEPSPAVGSVSGNKINGVYTARGIEIIFPMQRSTVRPIPGLDILIRPGLPAGTEIAFGDTCRAVTVSYRPSSAIPLPEGVFIGYASDLPGGSGMLVLDTCDTRPYGRIKGKIRYAKLRSVVYDQLKADIIPSNKPSYLEIWNWPFDLLLDESPYD